VLPISRCKTQERSASTDALIREWLFRFGVEHKEDVAPRLPLWLEAFSKIEPTILERLFNRTLKTCRFFPKVSEILEPLENAEKKAAPEAAEESWQRVLEIRRVHWNPDIPAPFHRAVAGLSDRVQQAARAAGVFQDFESVEALHVWAKKRFVESFIAYGEREHDAFLLPAGEIRDFLLGIAEQKALPASQVSFHELHKRGLEYSETLKRPPEEPPAPRASFALRVVDYEGRKADLERQKKVILERFAPVSA
jgi:hypothetical protein